MMHWRVYAVSASFACFSIITFCYPTCLTFAVLGLLTVLTVLLGVFTVVWGHLVLSTPHKTAIGADHMFKSAEQLRIRLMQNFDENQAGKAAQAILPPIFGRSVDSLLKQVLDFVVRDYIHAYLKEYAYEAETLGENIKEDIWGAVLNFHERLLRIDHVKLIAIEIVGKITNHFEKIRDAKTISSDNNSPPVFALLPHVNCQEKELNFLRNLSEILIMFLLPRSYSLTPTKYFLREILVCKVFKPTIDNITEPDFINRTIISYVENNNMSSNLHIRAFQNANSFEDFLKIISRTSDIDVLLSIRYNIVNKLMQATTLQNLNRSKGIDLDNDKNIPSGINKSDIQAAKKLKLYINELTRAKKECEQRLTNLGWDIGYQFVDERKRVLPLVTILDNVLGRKYLSEYLVTLASQDLVRFWIAVEELRVASRKKWHQLGAEIFYTFIRNPVSEIKVDKTAKKRMEAFLLGDKGPEVFYEVQNQVVQDIEDKYYQSFLISDYYKEMIVEMEKEDFSGKESTQSVEEKSVVDSISDHNLNVGEHSTYARRKLDQLQEKFNNKSQALQALRSSLKPESKVLSILESEVQWLQGEQRQLQAHIHRTEVWGENLGKWRATVQSAEVPEEKEPPQFVLIVHMLENSNIDEDSISKGWVVCRSLHQFQELHRKLRPMCSEIRSLDLPSNTFKFLFGKNDRATLEKAKNQIQKYLDFVLQDDKLNQSEAVYSFLSPSSDHLKFSAPMPKKTRFSFSTLFKSNNESISNKDSLGGSLFKDSEEDDISQYLDTKDVVDFTKNGNTTHSKIDEQKDTIAEPLYSLLGELFDMRGVFKYLRKSLIAFVQVTYGRNINRQIYETISWWFSEQMLHYYFTIFLKSFWPGGTLAQAAEPRNHLEVMNTERKAREYFADNVPELLTTLVGSKAAKNGALKVFNVLQDKKMNKQLFYEILEISIDVVFPELR